MSGVTCCSRVRRACGLYSTPGSVGSIRSLLTPKKRCKRPETGLASACPSRAEAEDCWNGCGGACWPRRMVVSEVGFWPVVKTETISLNWSGGSERGVRLRFPRGPETDIVMSMPRALVSRSTFRTGSTLAGLKNETEPWLMVYRVPKKITWPWVRLIRPSSAGLLAVPRSLRLASAWRPWVKALSNSTSGAV